MDVGTAVIMKSNMKSRFIENSIEIIICHVDDTSRNQIEE